MISKEERARLRALAMKWGPNCDGGNGDVLAQGAIDALDALDAAEKDRDQAEYDRDRFKTDREAIRSIYLTVLDSKAEAIVYARRAALEEAAVWLDDMYEDKHFQRAANLLRERAKAVG